ncbi:MAG: Stealth CR1 domain-containing protein [Bacteroidetes bacterium]|nr:Stealth CR1 domain-containing protein [Bacteroidota bacterium]
MRSIDAVITWVDGSDKEYKKKLEKHLTTSTNYKKQYLQANEIEYCVKSILKFAPFVRKIFIVTDSQKPSFRGLEDLIVSNKVKVVDHKEIFKGYEKYLPTFNIRSIDAVLHRIEDLSEKFVYFNDDVFLINKIREEDWFIKNKAVLMGKWATNYSINPLKALSGTFKKLFGLRPSFNASQSKAANISGFKKEYFKSYHTARPQIKSIIKDFYNNNPETLIDQIKYKFRNSDQFMPYSLCWHLLIKENRAIIKEAKELKEVKQTQNLNNRQFISILEKLDDTKDVKYLNIQDLNYASKDVFMIFDKWIRGKLKD